MQDSRLGRAPAAPREPGLLGIVGNPVRASLSPPMQEAALRSLGFDARYLAFEIAPGELRAVLRALRPLGFWGINVTIPYKEAVLRHLDRLDPEAAAIGAVNTVVVAADGLVGHNTDAPGFLRALSEAGGAGVCGARVLVAGAGGAARAVAHTALAGGCVALVVANRSLARAQALRRSLRRRFPDADIAAVEATAGAGFARLGSSCGVIVNATPLGGSAGDPLPVPRAALRPGQVVVDIVYRPRLTPLLAAAREAGARTVDGLGMLLHQGALSLRLWTGCDPPLEVMRRALNAAAGPPRR